MTAAVSPADILQEPVSVPVIKLSRLGTRRALGQRVREVSRTLERERERER